MTSSFVYSKILWTEQENMKFGARVCVYRVYERESHHNSEAFVYEKFCYLLNLGNLALVRQFKLFGVRLDSFGYTYVNSYKDILACVYTAHIQFCNKKSTFSATKKL